MKITPVIDPAEVSRFINPILQAAATWRAHDKLTPAQETWLTQAVREATSGAMSEAFNAGREYERRNPQP